MSSKRVYNKEVQKRSDTKRKDNPERKEFMKQLQKQPHIIKARRISVWKKRGVISDDYDELHNKYLNTELCEMCNIKMEGKGKQKKCLDHCHTTGKFRKILCNNCNWTLMRNK